MYSGGRGTGDGGEGEGDEVGGETISTLVPQRQASMTFYFTLSGPQEETKDLQQNRDTQAREKTRRTGGRKGNVRKKVEKCKNLTKCSPLGESTSSNMNELQHKHLDGVSIRAAGAQVSSGATTLA